MLLANEKEKSRAGNLAGEVSTSPEHYALEELRRDEVTDASERLNMPMENTFEYQLRDGKLYSDFGTDLDRVIKNGYEVIREAAKARPDVAFEEERRWLDMEELNHVKTLQPGENLIVFLPIPDAVRNGTTAINGYNRDRMKMLVRISSRGTGDHEDSFSITSMSLDRSYYQAMQVAAKSVGCSIPSGLGSEEVIARRQKVGSSNGMTPQQLGSTIRDSYDSELTRRYGGQWRAGRPKISELESLPFINQHSDLIDAHVELVANLKHRLRGIELKEALEDARYNFVAALDDRRVGKTVESLESSGAGARSEGRNYDGDCPTTSVHQQASRLGFNTADVLKCVTCPFCSVVVDAKVESGSIQCPECATKVVDGKVVESQSAMQTSMAEVALNFTLPKPETSSESQSDLVVERNIVIGGVAVTIFNQAGEVVATGRQAEKLAKQLSV